MRAEEMTLRPLQPASFDRDDRATIAVFATVMATVAAELYYLGRLGFDNPALPVTVALGLSLFISVSPFILWRFLTRGHYNEPEPWWRSQPALTIWAIAITVVAGALVSATGLNAGPMLAVFGFASSLAAVVIWLRRGRLITSLVFVAGSAAFAVWACGVAWSTRYETPVFWETLAYRADVQRDPLSYASMANAMRTYGVPSTGLDGVPHTPSHYGSAWLNSQWAWVTDTDLLSFYGLGPPVILIPLFFAGILLLAVEARKSLSVWSQGAERPLKTDYVAWLVFLAVSIGVIPTSGLDAMGIGNRHAMMSESYVIAVPLFLLTIAATIAWWRRKRTSLSAGDVVFLLVFVPLMLVAMGFLKVSLMLLLLVTGLGVALLGRLLRERLVAASAVVCLAATVVTYGLVSVAAQNQGIVPFAYMRFSVDAAWWPYFILVHLFWSWIYIYLRLREEKLASIGAIRGAALEGRITDVVVVAIVSFAGWLPGEMIDFHGGSAVYFSDVQRWLALSLLMASGWRWLAQWRKGKEDVAPAGGLGSVRLSQVWLAALAIPIGITIVLNAVRAPAAALRANVALRRALFVEAGVTGPVPLRDLGDAKVLAAGLRKSPDFALISTLRGLDRVPHSLKRQTLLFIPQSYTRFWREWAEPERCSYIPLIVPATSGLALLDGMPPVDCKLTGQYDMATYKRRVTSQLPADTLPATLCAKARAKGFSRVIVMDGAWPSGVEVHPLDCQTLRP